ncbi:hypothetical protein GCM10027048_33180 [Hymenobacter coalescens]
MSAATAQSTAAPGQAAAPTPPAAPQVIHGQVLNEEGQPLPGATVLLKGTKRVYSTNAEGLYSFSSMLPAQPVQVSMIGYADAELAVRCGAANAVTLQLLPGTRIKHGGRNNGKLLAVGRKEE